MAKECIRLVADERHRQETLNLLDRCAGRSFAFRVVALLGLAGIAVIPVQAGPFSALVRRAVRVADDTPIGQIDDVASHLARSGLSRDALEVELRRAGRLADNADDAARAAARSAEVARLLRPATTGLDPSVVRSLGSLDDAARESAAIMARGGKSLDTAIPDLAARAHFLRTGGAETIAAVGLYGDEVLEPALRLDAALRAAKIHRPPGLRPVSLRDFGQLMVDHGRAARPFWGRYITPYWKTWLTSGALSAYLIAPETFMDTLGNLTEEGMRRLTALVGPVAASAIRGSAAGMQETVNQVGSAFEETARKYRSGGIALVLMLVLAIGFAWSRSRARLLWPWRALLRLSGLFPARPTKSQSLGDDVL